MCVLVFICAAFIKRYYTHDAIAVMASRDSVQMSEPAMLSGTFIQTWMVKHWDEEMWSDEFDSLQEAGMEYVILTPSLFRVKDEKTGEISVKTIYPSKIGGTSMFTGSDGVEYGDIIEICLMNASKRNMKVFLGLNFSDEWWTKRRNEEWVYSMMHEGNKVADELWELYHERYPETFHGWYWCWEVDNFYSCTLDIFQKNRKMLANSIKIHTDYFEKKGMRLPLMLSPYMNRSLGTPEKFSDMWRYIFKNSGMKKGDVFCPQDSIGTGGMQLKALTKWFREFNRAVGVVPGIELWADVEAFDDSDWTAATLDRVIAQMEEVQPYVSNTVLFSYTHYYSPKTDNTGFHDTYVSYIETGELEDEDPFAPAEFDVWMEGDSSVVLSWNGAHDNIGVCGYKVFRNGEFYAKKQAHINNPNAKDTKLQLNKFVDTELEPGETYSYCVQAYDYAGNTSALTPEIFIGIPAK